MTRILTLIAAIAALGTLSACNTVQGAGEDIQAGGAAVSNAAEETEEGDGGY